MTPLKTPSCLPLVPLVPLLALGAQLANAANSDLFDEWVANPATAILPDFSTAGYAGGEQEMPRVNAAHLPVFYAADFGAWPDDELDDREALQRAIDAAGEAGGGIVQLSAGRYITNSDGSGFPIWIRHNNVILRGEGAGEDGTLIFGAQKYEWFIAQWTRPSMIMVSHPGLKGVANIYGAWNGKEGAQDWFDGEWMNNAIHPPAEARISTGIQDAPRNQDWVRVSNPENFFVGQNVLIMQEDKLALDRLMQPWDYRWFQDLTSENWLTRKNALLQALTVEAVEGDIIRFRERLVMDYRVAEVINFYPYEAIENVGVEDLRLEIVMTFRSDRWDANGTGLYMVHAHNSWIRNVTGVNLQSTVMVGSKNVTTENVRHTGEPFHDSIKFLNGHNSLMIGAKIEATTLNDDGSIKNVDHGAAVQHQATGNVYLDLELPVNCSIDLHSGEPYSNLYDRVLGGRHSESGGAASQLQAQANHTFWNWAVKTTDKVPYWWPVFDGKQIAPYSIFNMQTVHPIISGLHADPAYPTSVSVQYAEGHNFANGYFSDARVVAERIGTRVSPDSLYLAQRDHRLLSEFGKAGPEQGIVLSVDGPVRVLAGQTYSWDFGASTAEFPLTFFYSTDGGRSFAPVAGDALTTSFAAAGPVDLVFKAISSVGGEIRKPWPLKVYDDGYTILRPRSQFTAYPTSFTNALAGYYWNLLPVKNPGIHGTRTGLYYYGNNFGMSNRVKDIDLDYGGILYTQLPDEGVDLTGLTFSVNVVGPVVSGARIAARDVNGNWAFLNAPLSSNVLAQVAENGATWLTPDSRYGVQTGAFDPTRVNAVGVACLYLNYSAPANSLLLTLKEFGLTRGTNTAPAVAITAPAAGAGVTVGDTVTVQVSASDAETAIAKVELWVDDALYATKTSAPYHFSWLPVSAGSHTLLARALDTSGASTDSAPVVLDATANQSGVVPSIISATTASGTAGQAFAFQLVATGLPTHFSTTGLPHGLSLNAYTGEITGTPTAAGTYSVKVTAANAAGSSAPSTLTITIGASTTAGIALSTEENRTIYTLGETVNLQASGTGLSGSVTFLVDGGSIGADASAPFAQAWVPAAVGSYDLTASSNGLTSPVLRVVVLPAVPAPVSLAITTPANGQYFHPAPAALTLSGTLDDPDGVVAEIHLIVDGELLDILPPSANWSIPVTFGSGYFKEIRAVAYAIDGSSALSAPLTISVGQSAAPLIALTAPSAGSVFSSFDRVRFHGTATDPDGSIQRVEVWRGTDRKGNGILDTFIGTATLGADGTWSLRETTLPGDSHPVYAIAFDNSGDWTATPILNLTKSGRFSDDPLYGDAANYPRAFDAASRWQVELDAGNPVYKVRERFSYNYDFDNTLPESNHEHFRLSFRARMPHFGKEGDVCQMAVYWGPNKELIATDTSLLTNYTLGNYVFLIQDAGMPGFTDTGWVDWQLQRVGDRVTVWRNGVVVIDGVSDKYVGAGSVQLANHRNTGTDIFFDDITLVPLDAAGNPLPDDAGSISITAPADQAILPADSPVAITGTVADVDGIAAVTLHAGAIDLGEAAVAGGSFSLTTAALPAGTYGLSAVLTDALGNETASTPVTVILAPGGSGSNAAPSVSLDAPADGAAYVEYTPLSLSGTALDTDGSIDSVVVLINGTPWITASVVSASWTAQLPLLEHGVYTLQVRATDNRGAQGLSAEHTLTLTANQPPEVTWGQPAEGAALVADSQAVFSVAATDPDAPLGSVTGVEFFANGISLGQGVLGSGNEWSVAWTPKVLGAYALTARASDTNGGSTISAVRNVSVVPDPDPLISQVTYAGSAGRQSFHDVHRLSDGTLLIAGGADDLAWLHPGVPVTTLTGGSIDNKNTGRTGFLLHLSADAATQLRCIALPAGVAENIRWIKTTSKPGDPTGELYVSGKLDGDEYFVAKLNGNFVDAVPSAINWSVNARTSGNSIGQQPWDVGSDGRLVYLDTIGSTQSVRFMTGDGVSLVLGDLRGTHFTGETNLTAGLENPDPADPDTFNRPRYASDFSGVTASAISIPRDVQSFVYHERAAGEIVFTDMLTPSVLWADDIDGDGVADWEQWFDDENGSMKRGMWPLDIFLPAVNFQWKDGTYRTYGYNGYRSGGGIEIASITVDRDNNDFYFGVSAQSKFYDKSVYGGEEGEQPDFEPFVIGYDATGGLKWWSRLYHEWVDTNGNGVVDYGPVGETFWEQAETRRSPPDQYVDSLAIDYSTEPNTLVVNARCHGSNTENLWKGNAVAANPGASGFQNAFTGTESNIHIGWLGRMRADAGTLLNASYLSGYFRNVAYTQAPYAEPIHDGWPSHNAGWPNLTSTFAEPASLRVDAGGRVYITGVGPRMVTTFNAYQKMPKHTATVFEGNAPWSEFVRVFTPDLSQLVYSSCLTGIWTYASPDAMPEGADNTEMQGIFPDNNGLLVVGYQRATAGVADGNPIPVNNVPAWGRSTPEGETAIFGRLSFITNQNIAPSVRLTQPAANLTVEPGTAVQLAAEASDFDGTIAAVEFFVGGSLVSTDTAAPYTFSWTAPGVLRDYTVLARATDNDGATTSSSSRTITVWTDNLPPMVEVASPGQGTIFPRGSTVNIQIDAVDSDGSVASVQILVDGQPLTTLTSAPWSYLWSPGAGIYTVSAIATDNDGDSAQSVPVELTVGGPPQPEIVAINFGGDDFDDTGAGGLYWNGAFDISFDRNDLVIGTGERLASYTIKTVNSFGTKSGTRGSTLDFVHGDFTFPGEVAVSYVADKTHDGGDGVATVRIHSGSSFTVEMILLSSRAGYADGQELSGHNVGGSYSASSLSFTGGTTKVLDAGLGSQDGETGQMGPFTASDLGGGLYGVDLNVGKYGSGARALGYLNGGIFLITPDYDNTLPVADAGPDQTVADANNDGLQAVLLDGSASSDANDSIFAYTWFIDDVQVATGPTPVIELPVGTTVVTLEVKDEYFATTTDTVSITVNASPGVPPVAVPASDSPGLDANNDGFGIVSVDGSASYDPDGDAIVAYRWLFGATELATGAITQVNLPVGSHSLTLEVTDSWNKKGTAAFPVTVDPAPGLAPVALAGDDLLVEDVEDNGNHPVPLDASGSFDPDGDAIVSYVWKIGNTVIANGVTAAPVLSWGNYAIDLYVTDQWNRTGTDRILVSVVEPPDVAPVAVAGNDFSVTDGNDNGEEPITLNGSASYDPRGTIGIVQWQWALLDGTPLGSGPVLNTVLPVGTHEVVLTVTDDDGVSDTDSVLVTVKPAPAGVVTRIAIGFGSGTVDQRASGGFYWNGVGNNSNLAPSLPSILDVNGNPTDISMVTTNPFEGFNANRGTTSNIVVDGITFPGAVMKDYMVVENDTEGNDWYAAMEFSAPKAYRYKITVAVSRVNGDMPDGMILSVVNVAGTWGGIYSMFFTGGDTLTLDPALGPQNWDGGTLAAFVSEDDGSGNHKIKFQIMGRGGNKWGALNAIYIEATDMSTVDTSVAFGDWVADPAFALAVDDRDPGDNPDCDPYSNLLEYVLATNPSQCDPADLLRVSSDATDFIFHFQVRDDLTGANLTVEWSESMTGAWNTITPAGFEAVSDEGDFTTYVVRIPRNGLSRAFFRLRVELP